MVEDGFHPAENLEEALSLYEMGEPGKYDEDEDEDRVDMDQYGRQSLAACWTMDGEIAEKAIRTGAQKTTKEATEVAAAVAASSRGGDGSGA